MLYQPEVQPFTDSLDFAFEIDRKWKGPLKNKLGVYRFTHPDERATFDIVYLLNGSPGWKTPVKLLQSMREKGSIEDTHIIEDMKVAARPAKRIRYTSYLYDPKFRIGEKPEVLYTEEIVVPDPTGYHLLRFQAPQQRFWSDRKALGYVLTSITLAERKGESKADAFSSLRKKQSVGDRMQINSFDREDADRKRRKRYQAGLQLGQARPLTLDSKLDFPRLLRPGYAAHAQFMYFLRNRYGIGAELSLLQLPPRTEILLPGTPPVTRSAEAKATILSVAGRLRLNELPRSSPYLAAAVGYYSFEYSLSVSGLASTSLAGNLKSTGIALGCGAGYELFVHRRASLTLEARYQQLRLGSEFSNGTFEAFSAVLGTHYWF